MPNQQKPVVLGLGLAAALSVGALGFGVGSTSALSFDESMTINPVYQQYMEDVAAGNGDQWTLIPPKYILADTDDASFTGLGATTSSLPTAYDLTDYNLVTPVKNQGREGLCWAYATTTAIESNILKTKGVTTDLSPKQLDYLLADGSPYIDYVKEYDSSYSRTIGDGGSSWLAGYAFGTQYFPVDDDTFFDRLKNNSTKLDDYSSYREFTDYSTMLSRGGVELTFNDPISASDYMSDDSEYVITEYSNLESKDLETIKQSVYDYGAVVVGTYPSYTDNCYDSATETIVDRGQDICGDPGHALAIVGWDDEHEYTDPATGTTKKGAFLLQNSWGDSTLFEDYDMDAEALYDLLPEDAPIKTGRTKSEAIALLTTYIANFDPQENVWLSYSSVNSDIITFQSIRQTAEKTWDHIYDRSMAVDHTLTRAENEIITAYETNSEYEQVQALSVVSHGVASASANIEYQVSIDPTGTGENWQSVGSVYLGRSESGQKQITLDNPVTVSGTFLTKISAKIGSSSVPISDTYEPAFATLAYTVDTTAPEEETIAVPNTGFANGDFQGLIIGGLVATSASIATILIVAFTLRNRKRLFHRVNFKK